MLLAGLGIALLEGFWPRLRKSSYAMPIGDGLVILDGWILREQEAAEVLA
jgi:hypothetical protein